VPANVTGFIRTREPTIKKMPDILCPLRGAAAQVPTLPALDAGDRVFTFSELDEWVEGTSGRLMAAGLQPGDRMVLWMENDWRLVVLLLAALRAGIIACPLSTRLPSIDTELNLLDAAVLVSGRGGRDPDEFITRSATAAEVFHPHSQPATVVFTTGSSGRPKAALHSYGNHYYSAAGSNENIAVGPGDRWLLSLPMYHVGGLAILFRCLMGYGTIVLRPDFPVQEALTGITHLSLVSTQLQRILRSDGQLAGFKAILLGGSAIPRGLIDAAFDRGLPIHTSYGLTEMASQVATTRQGATRDELQTSGRILPHRQTKTAADGTLLVRGKTRFLGYVDGRALIEPFLEDGWFATGDVGHFTEDGLLIVSGRADNMFISGGENVMPEEIEDALTAINIVERAVVVDVDDEEFGRRPVAFVDVGELVLDPSELRAALAKKLPAFKIPGRFFLWPERDAAPGMKVNRAFFRREADMLMRRSEP